MKINNQINFIVIKMTASSLYSLIADGQYRKTSLGRVTWKSLIGSRASLYKNCEKEGFNAKCNSGTRAKIGILGNDQLNDDADCKNCNSIFGFGFGGDNHDKNTCGNLNHDNGKGLSIKAMGYISWCSENKATAKQDILWMEIYEMTHILNYG